ncbi:MAG TPA: zf-HC2 domain-containing protein [Pyrinomonadaceae bacterium]|nr:zf-HC2 domain-containing protein [Pyrinomonadaceae bacterium]
MMTPMSCGRAEKLMPLYAAGDLPAGRLSRAVAAHVAACASCSALAGEFRASREWVRAGGAAPEFGEEFYEGLRAGVLDQINRDTRPAAPSRLAPFFPALFAGRRLAYAASLALAACALALAFYLFREGGRPQHDGVAGGPGSGELVIPPRHTHATPEPDTKPGEQRPPHAAPRDDKQPALPKVETVGGPGYKRTPSLRRSAQPQDALPAPVLAASANDRTARDVAAATQRAETAGVARIEIQTADPSIRIIWLAPDDGEEARPGSVDPDR